MSNYLFFLFFGTAVWVAMETMNICIIHMQLFRVCVVLFLSFMHYRGLSYHNASVMKFWKYVIKI